MTGRCKIKNPLYNKGITLDHSVMLGEGKLVGFTLLRGKFSTPSEVEKKAKALLLALVKTFNVNQMINVVLTEEGDALFKEGTFLRFGGSVKTPDVFHWSAREEEARRELQALALLSKVVLDYDIQNYLEKEFACLIDKQFTFIL